MPGLLNPFVLSPPSGGGGGGAYAAAVLATSPLAYYRLGESSGSTMVDSSGNGHDGAYTGSPTFGVAGGLTGDADTAITLDGSDYGVAPGTGNWADAAHFTTMARIKTTDSGSYRSFVDRHRNSNASGFQLRVNPSGHVELLLVAGGSLDGNMCTSTSTVNDGSWHHVAGICDGTNLTIVIDGTNVTQEANAGQQSPVAASDGIHVGANLSAASGDIPAQQFIGTIDEAAYWGTALTTAQVATIAAAQ